MDAVTALLTRSSAAQLTEPAPTAGQLEIIFQAGLHANDHMRLKPWKFLLVEGEARHKFGQLMADTYLAKNPALSQEKYQELAAKPLRAPLIIVVVATVRDHKKVPAIEQLLSAGAAAQLMTLAAHAQGIGAIWRTGSVTYDKRMAQGLGLSAQDQIVGFLYMGTAKHAKQLVTINSDDFVERWRG